MEDLEDNKTFKVAHDLYIGRILRLTEENEKVTEELKTYKSLYEELASTDKEIMIQNVELWNKLKDKDREIEFLNEIINDIGGFSDDKRI